MSENNAQQPTWTESDLSELADLICGKGRFAALGAIFGTGIHTYPDHPNNQGKYEACCELERMGIVSRKNCPGSVFFEPRVADAFCGEE